MIDRLKEISEKKWFIYVSLALGGVMTGLTLTFPEIGILGWLSLIPAAYTIMRLVSDRSVRLRTLYGYGLFFFMSFYLVVYHWLLYLYPLTFLGLDKIVAFFVVLGAWVGLPLFQALGAGFLFVLLGILARTKTVSRLRFLLPFICSAIWTVHEWVQTLGPVGVPWGRIAISQTAMPIMVQPVSLFGTYFITFLIVTVNFLLAYALLFGEKKRVCALISAGLFVLNLTLGTALYFTYDEPTEHVKVASVQGNYPSGDKWTTSVSQMLNAYCNYTFEVVEEGAEIVVWPETAVPLKLLASERLTEVVVNLAKECGATLLIGTFTEDEETGLRKNSILMIEPDGTISDNVYSKKHRVPLGEFVPLRGLITAVLPFLETMNILPEDIIAGDDSYVYDTEFGGVGSLICFDSIYEEVALDAARDGAGLLILPSNDSWFGDSAGLRMHHAQGKLRATETGRYILRSGNTGITSIITPRGEVAKEIDVYVQDVLVGEVGFRYNTTLYCVIGNTMVYILIAFLVGVYAYDVSERVIARRAERNKKA